MSQPVSPPMVELLAGSSATITDDVGTVTGPELLTAGEALARQWVGDGLGRGQRVGLWLANGRRYLEALAACAVGGFVAVSVNTRWSPSEARELLVRSGAAMVRTGDDDRLLDPTPDAAHPLRITDGGPPFVVFTTSGTTSRPKMVLHGQRSIAVHAGDASRAFGYGPDTPILVAMPLCGVFGLVSLTAALAADAPIVLPPAVDPAAIAATVERDRIVAMNGSDDLFHRMLATDADLSSLGVGGYARFNTSLDGVVARAAERGMVLTGLYGMSEVQALFSLRDPGGPAAERGKAGGTVVSCEARVRVVDDELQVQGPSLFTAYLAEGGAAVDDELTASQFTDDAWFRTGDAAVMEEPVSGRDTFVYQARMGDVLRLGGFLVSPSEIEAVVVQYDGVEAAQVVAVDRPTGARPVAFVTGNFSAGDLLDEQAVIDHCAANLARFKCPVRVIALDEFPTTPSANGTKIQKVKLRSLAAEALSTGP